VCYASLDLSPYPSIIKNVMIRQSKRGRRVKKAAKRSHAAARPGLKRTVNRHQPVLEAIDPADFFDPEEFGVRRPNSKSLQS
jgi:hypothetical protein